MLEMKNSNVLIKKIEKESDGLLVYTDDQKQRSYEGEIKATKKDSEFNIGDIVLFSEFSGEQVYVDGCDYLLMNEEDIWCVRRNSPCL